MPFDAAMRPVVLLGARKDKAPTPPLDSNMPQTLRMATEEDLEGSSKKLEPGSDSTFGVRSLQDTIYEGSLSGQKADEGEQEDEGKRVGEEDDNREEEPRGDNDGGVQNNHEGRRRSTLKPRPRPQTRDSSRESIEQFSASTGYSSPSQPSQENHSPPSMSQSLASLSFSSQAPLSSIPSSPKSTSNRSFRHSDEESMDDGGSQAIASSEDDDAELRSSIQDSAPQLIMPSIKMPSRRPFTERGKGMGRLKVMIAGDSGMRKIKIFSRNSRRVAEEFEQVLARRHLSNPLCRPVRI